LDLAADSRVLLYFKVPVVSCEKWSAVILSFTGTGIFFQKMGYRICIVSNRDAPDNPAFYDIRYPAGYGTGFALPDTGIRPDTENSRISGPMENNLFKS
jgi:hypothetical protein